MKRWLWGIAESADWNGWPPRRFWAWMLRPRTPEDLVRLIAMELNGGEPRGNLKGQWNSVRARHILRALSAAGCVVVPREATEEMLQAGHDNDAIRPSAAWHAMIAASPFREVIDQPKDDLNDSVPF